MVLTTARSAIRHRIRTQRLTMSRVESEQFSKRICHRITRSLAYCFSQHIAVYFPNKGEVDLRPLFKKIWQHNKSCYLPVLHPFQSGKLQFHSFSQESRLKPNIFGIPEPCGEKKVELKHLDLVLMPMVAFDRHLNRMGMGGGYYDRTFWAQQPGKGWHCPRLMGVAFDYQRVESIPVEYWDVSPKTVMTERQHYQRSER